MKLLHLSLTVALITIFSVVHSQEKHTIYQVKAQALFAGDDAVFKSGAGVSAGAYFPVSPSFNMGPTVAADFSGIKGSSESFNPVSLRFTVIYFPIKILRAILGDTANGLVGFNFKAGIGHSFRNPGIVDDLALNTADFDIGYQFRGKASALGVHFGLTSYALKQNYIEAAGRNNGLLTTLGLSYNWLN